MVVMEAVVVTELVISTTSVEAVTSTLAETAAAASEVLPKSWVTWHLVVVESMIHLSLCSCHEVLESVSDKSMSHLITAH